MKFQQLVEQDGRVIQLDAGDHIFRQGSRDSNLYLVRSGLLKAYYIRADGREHIKSFQCEGAIIGSMVAILDGDPCTFSLLAIEASRVVALPYRRLEQASRGDVELANALVDFLAVYGKRKERREHELLTIAPEERYTMLLESMPEIVRRISQADIAAYIGVTPQALSRIKKRLSGDTN